MAPERPLYSDSLVFNGIDGATGGYLQDPLRPVDLVDLIVEEGVGVDAVHQRDLHGKHLRTTRPHYAPAWSVNPKDLSTAGWGVIFPHDCPPAIREALRPLLDHRRAQAGRINEKYYREYAGPDGHRPEETKQAFLTRHGVAAGMPADPEFMPYYLLVVGDPQRIPYRFQYQLDVEYAVGRLWFETAEGKPELEAFHRYAASVVAAETGEVILPRKAAFVGVHNPNDPATGLSEAELVRPLMDGLKTKLASSGWAFDFLTGPDAKKAMVATLLGGAVTPALLFTASHGMGFPSGDPRQLPHQGALLCQDWPGPKAWSKPIPEAFYLSADDLGANARPAGLISFHFACYGAGTPRVDDFPRGPSVRAGIAPRPFVARLPQRLLGHPNGGALAVIGHVERAWTTSFIGDGRVGRQLQAFEGTLGQLLQGYPVGFAMEFFNNRYAALSEALTYELNEIQYGRVRDDHLLAGLWVANADARNYAVLGDPAVRLPVNGEEPLQKAGAGVTKVRSATSTREIVTPKTALPTDRAGEGAGLVFDPPTGFRDVSEYGFLGEHGRRLTIIPVNENVPTNDLLLIAARAYAHQLTDLFTVSDPAVEPLRFRPDGAAFAVVSAILPDPPAGQRVERTALVRFRDGRVVRVTLSAASDDGEAEADFHRAVDSARLVEVPQAAFSFAPPAATPMEQAAGPIAIELPPSYQEVTARRAFRSPDGSQEVRVRVDERTAVAFTPSASPTPGRLVQATDDTGKPFAYELAPDPRAARDAARRVAAGQTAKSFSTPEPASPADTVTVERIVSGRRLTVEVRSSGSSGDLTALANQIADTARPSGAE